MLLKHKARFVACAISGGVDSAAAAYLLKKQGHKVVGVFMTNWDPLDEGTQCSASQDLQDAQFVCEKLNIPFYHRNYVREYWNHVFESVLHDYTRGWTPNPDILCNKHIKFDALSQWVFQSLGADCLATGHYARTSTTTPPRLLRSVDPVKDQTFWLSQMNGAVLQKGILFPVGDFFKSKVRQIADKAGLHRNVKRKESMGMCFVGKRRFYDFIESYIPPAPGHFKIFESGVIVGEHQGIHHFTLGQRANIAVNSRCHYIAKLDPLSGDIYLVDRPDHPVLFMQEFFTASPHWIHAADNPFTHPDSSKPVQLDFQWQNKFRVISCEVTQQHQSQGVGSTGLHVRLQKPMRCIAPGQYAVFYRGEHCLGSAPIIQSLHLLDTADADLTSHVSWDLANVELSYDAVAP